MASDDVEADFSYRNLTDMDEHSLGNAQEAVHPADIVTVVTHPLPEPEASAASPEHALLLADARPARPESSEDMWVEGTERPTRRSSAARRSHNLSFVNHQVHITDSPVKPRAKTVVQTHPVDVNLHGKDLRRFVSIGTIETIARHSNSFDWSDVQGGSDELDHSSLMDPYYDLTQSKLTKLFSLFHPDVTGMVTYDGFRLGLEAMGIVCNDDKEFEDFIEKVDEDHSGGISYEEFQQAIQEIKLAQLFKDEFVADMTSDKMYHQRAQTAVIGSMEYSPDRIRSVYPIRHIEKFIYSKKSEWAAVRWIHGEGYDPLLLRRLSVRYRLHPLAVEDALELDRERPKYEKYDEHSSLILQTVHAVDLQRLKMYQRMYRASLYAKDDTASPFETMGKAELVQRLQLLEIGQIMTNPEQLSLYILKNVVISIQEGSTTTLWTTVKSRCDVSYSKIRHHGPPFLVHSIVDSCVDELTPIVQTMGAKLMMLDRLLQLEPSTFDINRLLRCSKQIKGLKRICKPLNEVIVQLTESDDLTGEILRYFRDVQDHVAIVEEDCDKHLDACRGLIDDFHNLRAAQQNQVSFVLALVAAIFLPAQFLTGLYGMNFSNMPELGYYYGYYIWWAVVLFIAMATVVYFHFYKKWL